MKTYNEQDEVMRHSMNSLPEGHQMRPYHSPQLVVYGDLKDLTNGGGGRRRDDGGVRGANTKP
jgi:hypothetical protein